MKKVIIFLIVTGVFTACHKSDEYKNTDLTGTWKLVEVLADPGDGSGTFHSVSSDKIIEFHPDGTVTSNGSLCVMTIESGSPDSGTYSLADSTIHSPACQYGPVKLRFHQRGSTLSISYPCIEPCIARYRKKD